MRRGCWHLTFVLLLQALCLGQDKSAVDLFTHASELSDIRTPVFAPFRLKAKVHILGNRPREAECTLLWVSADRWREEIRSDNKIYIRIGEGSLVWSNNDSRAVVDIHRQLRELVIPLTLYLRPGIKLSKIKDKKWNGSKAKCVLTTGGDWGEEQFCFDPLNGVLLGTLRNNDTLEYSDFQNVRGKIFPWKVRGSDDGKLQSEISVEDLTAAIDPPTFSRDIGFQSRPGCEFPNIFEPIYLPDPEYPSYLRTQGVQHVKVEAIVDERGNVTDPKILVSAGELDKYALKALGRWRFKPATCGTTPVPFEFDTDVNFLLR